MLTLKNAIDLAGGVTATAKACNVSPRAIYKWLDSGNLPRTDYTGETEYAIRIAELAKDVFSAKELLESTSPSKSVA